MTYLISMSMQSLLDPEVQKFIRAHEADDIAALALKKPPSADWDYPRILDQIKARQKAKKKIPSWLEVENIILPSPDLLEQASSSPTAAYKASLVSGESFADLTGGMGVDTWAFAKNFTRGFCIERDKHSAELLAHNLPRLTNAPVEVRNETAEDFVSQMNKVDLAIIDPQRRDQSQKGKFKFADCAPNVLELLPALLDKAETVMIKTSPMLDISQAVSELGHCAEIHIVEHDGDCKELVFLLNRGASNQPPITAVKVDEAGKPLAKFSFTITEEQEAKAAIAMPEKYLYEPSPAFQKCGAFGLLATRFGLKKLHANTHLYTANDLHSDFPGRIFEIEAQFPPKAGKIPLKQANISVRNFPMTAQELRKKLKIKDGGDTYIFACTLADGSKSLLSGRKPKN